MGPVRQNSIHRTVRSVHVCAVHCVQLLHTILHRTDLIFPSCPPDDHHCSDDVYFREGEGGKTRKKQTRYENDSGWCWLFGSKPAQCLPNLIISCVLTNGIDVYHSYLEIPCHQCDQQIKLKCHRRHLNIVADTKYCYYCY